MISIEGETFLQILVWLVPGVVIAFVRSRFLTGKLEGGEPSIRGALGISLIYGVICYPWQSKLALKDDGLVAPWAFYFLVLIAPALVGVLLGLLTHFQPMRRLASRFGIALVHDIPSAWDYVFARRKPSWVLVTLKNETKYRGCYAGRSFSSSDPDERDLFLDQLSILNEETDEWLPRPRRSILICKDEISTIELCEEIGEERDR